MAVSAKLKHLRMSPRKVQPVCDQIRGKGVQQALDFLMHCRRKAAQPLLKLLNSAVANADQKGKVDVDHLVVKRLMCDKGTTIKRWLPRARGSASPILKRSCHITVVLDEK